ncbi:MAG: helix-turn-helix domain-containing protein [Paenibacillaceae bacterium]|nr:helix-turn-helix domain-containing protein [Paenibacillaceae bacterium]
MDAKKAGKTGEAGKADHAMAASANRTYAKLLLSLVVSIVSTLFAVSIILYVNFERVALSHINDSEETNLSQTSASVKFMDDSVRTLALQIYTDRSISGPIEDTTSTPVELSEALEKLNTYRYISPFIHSIYVYSGNTQSVYISSPIIMDAMQRLSDFSDREAAALMQKYEGQSLRPIPRLIPGKATAGSAMRPDSVFTYVIQDAPDAAAGPKRVVVVNISEAFIRETIKSLEGGSPSDTSIVDAAGRLIVSNNNEPMLTDVADRSYVEKIRAIGRDAGYFVDRVNGVKSLVIYATYKPLDWTFVRTIPYAHITSRIDRMKEATLGVGLAILAVGVAASYVLSRRLYKPIGRAFRSLETLEAEKRDRFDQEKQDALRGIVRGVAPKPAELGGMLAAYRIDLDPAKPLRLVLLRIDHFAAFCSAYNAADRTLLRYAAMNIARELFAGSLRGETVDMDGDRIAVLLHDEGGGSEAVREWVERLQEAAETYVQMSLSAVVSAPFRLEEAGLDIYGEAEQASLLRLIRGHRCIIEMETMDDDASEHYVYPFHREQAFAEALLAGRSEDARQRYEEMAARAAETNSYTAVQLTLTHLAFAAGRCLELMRKNGSFLLPDIPYGTFVTEFQQMETLAEINAHFARLFERMAVKPEEKTKSRYDELTASVIALIRANYGEPNLSLDSIADSVGMSPAYLGRLFKKLTVKSIPDYILEVRIEQAKSMLAHTDAAIGDIAESVGFANSTYFFKVFKKTNGVTPNEYRQSVAASAGA